ncbi:S1 RNA-binding domain-containing protein [Gayadomonas joobiniege]|uniref:CvfB family protein n=1 Tax=Gayadomonas joobiniege TaxID=1234606 RepID=UPI00036F3A5A|nr:S1-like domain-containing RNA-binding protein [Gayadomonas joobiniege]
MLKFGRVNRLTVIRGSEIGFWLDGGVDGEVFLPRKWALGKIELDQQIEAFVYYDSKDRLTATMRKVPAQAGQFASLRVSAISPYGAFLDLGLDKDVLLPLSEQKQSVEIDRRCLVYLFVDEQNRLTATAKVDQYLDLTPPPYKKGEAVELVILNRSDLGYNAIINHQHRGVIYANEVFETLYFGSHKQGFIKHIRDDGKIDLMLQSHSETMDRYSQLIYQQLKQNDGYLPLHDKSSPVEIKAILNISKGAFKKAIGSLYKQKRIVILHDGIRLNTDS